MGTSRASNPALWRQLPHEGLTARAVEPGGEGSQAVLLPAGEDLQTPAGLCKAGSSLPRFPVLPSLLVSPLCQLPCLQENSSTKDCQCRVVAGRWYLVFLWEVEQTSRLLRMGKCRVNGLSHANFGPPEAELSSFLQPPATPLWVAEGWGRALRNPWQMESQGGERNCRERASSAEQRGCTTWRHILRF